MGAPVVEILAERGNQLVVTTRKSRKAGHRNINYVQGNAHDVNFVHRLLQESFGAVIDFMIYTPEEFPIFSELYMKHTTQYIFLSSARVYADSPDERITEDSPRLLDVTKDQKYLATNEYALAKAREENVLKDSGFCNYTIIRPYITYYTNRLQLGIFEKEAWLQRALDGKKIVFSRNIADKYTTLTNGYDVALRIADLVGKECALGQAYHITTEESIRWKEALDCYLDVLEKQLGKRPEVLWMDESDSNLEKTNYYQIHCDREYNRRFSNAKIQRDSEEEREFTKNKKRIRGLLDSFFEWKERICVPGLEGRGYTRSYQWRKQ